MRKKLIAWTTSRKKFLAETGQAYLFLLPALAVFSLFVIYPFVNAIIYSTYDIRTRTVPGPAIYVVEGEIDSWIAALRRGRIPEPIVSGLERQKASRENLWVRLREAFRWVVRDETTGTEYIILKTGDALSVHEAKTGWGFTWVGLSNFRQALRDRDFQKALSNTVKYVATSVPITMVLALMLAALLNQVLVGRAFFRLVVFLPYVTSAVAIATVWAWIYDRHFGLLNFLISSIAGIFGKEFSFLDWLGTAGLSIPAVVIMNVWRFVGYQTVIFLAGMQGIDREYYEAAKVDGASGLQLWWRITLPLLTPQIFFVLIISLIGSFRIFDEVITLFKGPGPEKSALTIVYYVFTNAFDAGQYGLASAASVILFAIIFALSLFQLTVVQRRVHYER